jgi:hypothetical protein
VVVNRRKERARARDRENYRLVSDKAGKLPCSFSPGGLARFENSQNVKMNGTTQTTAILADRRSGQLAGVVLADFTQQFI